MSKTKREPKVSVAILSALSFLCQRKGFDFMAYVAGVGSKWIATGVVTPSSTGEFDVTQLFAHHAHAQIGSFDKLSEAQDAATTWVRETPPPAEECGCPDLSQSRPSPTLEEQLQGARTVRSHVEALQRAEEA